MISSLNTDASQSKKVCVIVPVYNEEANLRTLVTRLLALQNSASSYLWNFILIDDGSRDSTKHILKEVSASAPSLHVICLSRNFGHQLAVSAGLDHAEGDYLAIIDGDLQDPPELIPAMVQQLESGINMVYGQRISRHGEGFLKKLTAKCFYRMLHILTNVPIPVDTGDFRAFDKKVLQAIKRMPEYHRFLRGMFAWSGFNVAPFPYERQGRHAGITKYSWKAMLRLATNALFSFSDAPLKIASYGGLGIAFVGMLGIAYIILQKLFYENYIIGISAILSAVLVIGGFQLIILGIIGAYIGKIFEQVKGRPLYLIDTTYNINERSSVTGVRT